MPADIEQDVERTLAEDIGSGDVTAVLIPETVIARATVISRESAVLCGTAWFDAVFRRLEPAIAVTWYKHDGDAVSSGDSLCKLHGPARPMLTGERTALNFLQTLSGTATLARRYADAVKGSGAVVLDTRKTIPGLRNAQKYAVAVGGCRNHRHGLYDGVLIKENHIMAAGSIGAAVAQARRQASGLPIEVEVENIGQLEEALAAGAELVLLDNFSEDQLRAAVSVNARRSRLEASGGVTLENIKTIAATGVDYISTGALTKDIHAVDLSMRFETR